MTNAGYNIIAHEMFDNKYGIALGVKGSAYGEEYVTWMYRAADTPDYFWGHYYMEKDKAWADYHERLATEYARK